MQAVRITDMLRTPDPRYNETLQQVLDLLIAEHRTNQASIVRSLQYILQQYADRNRGTDARNEAAVDFAEQVSCIDSYISYV